MRVYMLWHEGDADEVPWIIDVVDQYTIDVDGEFPPPYLERRADIGVREMIVDIPEEAVRALFSAPVIRGLVVKDDSKDSPVTAKCTCGAWNTFSTVHLSYCKATGSKPSK